jgi:hypothetical protein
VKESGLDRATYLEKVLRAPTKELADMYYDLAKKKYLDREKEKVPRSLQYPERLTSNAQFRPGSNVNSNEWKKHFMFECAFVKEIYLFLFTDISRRRMTCQVGAENEIDNAVITGFDTAIYSEASVRTEFGPEEICPATITRTAFGPDEILHAVPDLNAMRFIFTDIYGSLTTFRSFSRSMHTTDCSIYISQGSCLLLNTNGTCLSMHIAVYQDLSMLISAHQTNTSQSNEFFLQLATQQFQSDVEICPEINVAIHFRWTASTNQITISYISFEENITNEIGKSSTKISCDKMITGYKAITGTCGSRGTKALEVDHPLHRYFNLT